MRNRPVTWHAETRLPRVGLEPRHKLVKVFGFNRRTGNDAELEPRKQRDGHEILFRIKAGLVLHHRQQKHCWAGGYENGRAIRIGVLDGLYSDQSIGPRAIFNNDCTIQKLTELLRDEATERVPAAASRKRKDHSCQRPSLAKRIVSRAGQ